MSYVDWAMKEMESLPNTKSAYLYKQKVVAQITEKANELIGMGLTDNNVIVTLLMDEFKDINRNYYDIKKKKEEKNKKSKLKKLISVGGIGYVFLVTILYLIISFATHAWTKSWLVFAVGLNIPIAAIMFALALKFNKGSLTKALISRLLSAGSVMLFTVVCFLTMSVLNLTDKSWLIFIFGVAAVFMLDIVLSVRSKQKTTLISALIYIPAIAAIVYVALGVLSIVSWHPGWLIVVCSGLVDLAVIAISILKGPKDEEDEQWEDD